MQILGNILGGIFLVAMIFWLVALVGSFFTAWISLMLLVLQVTAARRASPNEQLRAGQRLANRYDDVGSIFVDERYAKRRKMFAVSASVFVISMLTGIAVMLLAKKLHG